MLLYRRRVHAHPELAEVPGAVVRVCGAGAFGLSVLFWVSRLVVLGSVRAWWVPKPNQYLVGVGMGFNFNPDS